MRRLYLCPTLLHLFNCIVLEHSKDDHENADLWLSDASDFTEKVEPLKQCGLFQHVHLLEINDRLEQLKALPEVEERREIMCHPLTYFTQVAAILDEDQVQYDEMYCNLDSYLTKVIYYCFVERGMSMKVHFVNEGTASYALDMDNTRIDWLPHKSYGAAKFEQNIHDLWLYHPELYTGGVKRLQLKQLPYSIQTDAGLQQMLHTVFGHISSFSQKVVFFESCFMGDGILSNEMKLFQQIANVVGKENIIVKRHPRNTIDRFTPMGYAVMENASVPWEIMLMDMDVSNKVLVSIASFTCLSPMEMYGKKTHALLLEPLLLGRVYFLQSVAYKKFFAEAIRKFNEDKICIWRPETNEELTAVLQYLKMVVEEDGDK